MKRPGSIDVGSRCNDIEQRALNVRCRFLEASEAGLRDSMPALSRAEAQALFEPQEINCPHLTLAMAAEGFVAEVAQVEEAESPQPEAEVEAPAEVLQSVEVAPVEVAPAAPKKAGIAGLWSMLIEVSGFRGDVRPSDCEMLN